MGHERGRDDAAGGKSGGRPDTPWVVVGAGEAARLVAAHRQARRAAEELRAAARAAGMRPADLASVCGGVDGAGRPVVVVCGLSVRAARRLARLLHGMPTPPSPGDTSRAA